MATLGVTEVLGSNVSAASCYFYVGTAPFDGVVDDIQFHITNYQSVGMAIYTGTSSAPAALVSGSDTGIVTAIPGTGWLQKSYTAKPTITTGQHLWLMCYRTTFISITKGDDLPGEQFKTGVGQTAAPNTAAFSSTQSNRAISTYITIREPSGQRRGGLLMGVGRVGQIGG